MRKNAVYAVPEKAAVSAAAPMVPVTMMVRAVMAGKPRAGRRVESAKAMVVVIRHLGSSFYSNQAVVLLLSCEYRL